MLTQARVEWERSHSESPKEAHPPRAQCIHKTLNPEPWLNPYAILPETLSLKLNTNPEPLNPKL